MNLKKYFALTRAGVMDALQFRMSMFVMFIGNLLYLIVVYFLWKAIYDSSGTDVVNGMTFTDTLIYLVLATALFGFMEMYTVWQVGRDIQSGRIVLDLLKPIILQALTEILEEDGINVRGIYERSDAKVREKEGMERKKCFLSAPFDTQVPITENGIHYLVDVENGQKTGFFLDQKLNRLAIRPMCRNADVLDCFTHTGSFGLNAAAGGARHVLSVDASDTAIRQAEANARLNGYADRIDYLTADVFELLPRLESEKKQFDVVILDPPAFTKSRNSIRAATRGYREINLRGMKLTRSGGYLATCSCSHFMDQDLFARTIAQAAHDAHVRLRQVEFRTQAPDHPIVWAADDSYYLKFYIFQVVRSF